MRVFSAGVILISIVLTGCSSHNAGQRLEDSLFESVTGKLYSRNASSCPNIRNSCRDGDYQEWIQDNGQKACACNR